MERRKFAHQRFPKVEGLGAADAIWEVITMRKTGQFLAKIWSDESGISSVEYALLLAFVAAGIILGAETLSEAVQTEMFDAASCIELGSAGCPSIP